MSAEQFLNQQILELREQRAALRAEVERVVHLRTQDIENLQRTQARCAALVRLLRESMEYVAMMRTRFKAEEDRIEAAKLWAECHEALDAEARGAEGTEGK